MIAPSRRLIFSCLLLLVASALVSLWGLGTGLVPLSVEQVISALLGDAPRNVAMVVTEWRLPRVLMALLIGAALGVSGAIFQSLTRNPLGSPDVMGFNTGAWSGVLVAMVMFGQNLAAIAMAAMAGGILTALAVWLLAWRNGIETFRLIIIGIGVRAMLVAFNTWLLLRASLETALSAGLWYAGSLNGLTWGKTWPSAPLILLMLVCGALLARRMRLLEMGDDTACALGLRVERSRLLLPRSPGRFRLSPWWRPISRAASAAPRAGGWPRRRCAALCCWRCLTTARSVCLCPISYRWAW